MNPSFTEIVPLNSSTETVSARNSQETGEQKKQNLFYKLKEHRLQPFHSEAARSSLCTFVFNFIFKFGFREIGGFSSFQVHDALDGGSYE